MILTTKEFSEAIGVSISTVKRWRKDGLLVPEHQNPKRRYYTDRQVEEYKKNNSREYGVYGTVEFAKLIGVDYTTVRRWVNDGAIVPAGQMLNGRNYFTQAQVDEYFGK